MFLKIKFFLYFIFLIISTFLINVSNGQTTTPAIEVCSRRCLSNTNCVYEAKTSIVFVCDDFLNWYKGNANVSISTDEDGSINDTISYRKQRCPPLPNQTKTFNNLVINSLSSTDSGPGIYKAKEFQDDPTFKCSMNIYVYGN
jgi:hypothetical protein